MSEKVEEINNQLKTTLENVIMKHNSICLDARSIVAKKGHDYNKQSQENGGDTLANMRLAKQIGLAESYCQSTMIRLFDKMMRLQSLTKNPTVGAEVTDESVRNTILDSINYLVYLHIFYEEESIKKT
jgi:hypothetical protein